MQQFSPEGLRAARIEQGISMEALAAAAGVTLQTIWMLETGRRQRVDANLLLRAAHVLDVPFSDFLCDA